MSIYWMDESDGGTLGRDFCLDTDDPSLNGQGASALKHEYVVGKRDLDRLFLSGYGLDYVSEHFLAQKHRLRVLTYPRQTTTCYEKAKCLGRWSPLNTIKTLYLESSAGELYAIVVPETGCFLNKEAVRRQLALDDDAQLTKAQNVPKNMTHGTCSPFVAADDFSDRGGRVRQIVFDKEALRCKDEENALDDFSFGLDHRFSIQLNYAQCFDMLRERYPDAVVEAEVLTLAFKENLTRKKGRIKINYEFESLNYLTARFIDHIHGYGDVSIVNDYCDEIYLPEALTPNDFQCANFDAYRAPG